MNKKVVNKIKMSEQQTDFAYWQTQSYQQRLEALEQIRSEYILWKYHVEPRFQRVCDVIRTV